MEEILKKLMSTRCVSIHNPSMRCHGKGCDGQCAQFQTALMELTDKTENWFKNNVCSINDSGINLGFGNYAEMIADFHKPIEK